jgi:hypothetical protein
VTHPHYSDASWSAELEHGTTHPRRQSIVVDREVSDKLSAVVTEKHVRLRVCFDSRPHDRVPDVLAASESSAGARLRQLADGPA